MRATEQSGRVGAVQGVAECRDSLRYAQLVPPTSVEDWRSFGGGHPWFARRINTQPSTHALAIVGPTNRGIAIIPILALARAACSTVGGDWRARKTSVCMVTGADELLIVWSCWLCEWRVKGREDVRCQSPSAEHIRSCPLPGIGLTVVLEALHSDTVVYDRVVHIWDMLGVTQ